MTVDTPITPCLLIGEGENKKEIVGSILQIDVEEDHDLASVFSIRLAIVRETAGLWTFLDEGAAQLWAKIEIKMNVGDGEQVLFAGYVTDIRVHIDPSEGESYLELVGMDASCLMGAEEVIKAWPETRDSAIAVEIFKKYDLDYEVEDTEVDHAEQASTIIQRESDIHFLKRLARRNGCECIVVGHKGIFARPDLRRLPLPDLAAHFGEKTNLTSFEANVNAQRPTAIEWQQVDVLAKEVRAITTYGTSQTKLGKTGIPAPPTRTGRPQMFVRHQVVTNHREAAKLVDAIGEEAAWFVEAKGEVDSVQYGELLRVRRVVPIKGVGELLSGLYYLTSVHHHYTTDRYIQHFTARRNATTTLPSDFAGGVSLPF